VLACLDASVRGRIFFCFFKLALILISFFLETVGIKKEKREEN
jgi:hypothetical protein